jgi:sensor histidine kinase regulating citrate/malate metabolism
VTSYLACTKHFIKISDSKGLDLSLQKNQVVSMNGKIEADSEENVGTTFKYFAIMKKLIY